MQVGIDRYRPTVNSLTITSDRLHIQIQKDINIILKNSKEKNVMPFILQQKLFTILVTSIFCFNQQNLL